MPTPPGGAAPAGADWCGTWKSPALFVADEAVLGLRPRYVRTIRQWPLQTLYSALATVGHEVTGRYSHRHPALEAARAEIEDWVPGRRWKHRLAEFNAEATFEDVKAVLTSAIAANLA